MRIHVAPRRCLCSTVYLACLLLPAIGRADDLEPTAAEVSIEHVAGSVYVLKSGHAGNVAASIGPDGIVLVDAMTAPLASKLRAALKTVSDRSVRVVINTHYHGDHTGGNAELAREGAEIVAHERVRERLARGGVGGNFGAFRFEYAAAEKLGTPSLTYRDEVRLHESGEEIRVQHVADSHTDGDSVVYFPRSNVVHVGDEFVTYGFPDIEIASGGSVAGTIAVLERLLRELPADVKVIPGHGPVSKLDDMRAFVAMLRGARDVVKAGIARGKRLEQLQREDVLARWKSFDGFFTRAVFIEFIYNDLTGVKRWPVVASSKK